jgi:hypothetical protein
MPYIHNYDVKMLFDQWAKCLADGWRGLRPHLMEWMARVLMPADLARR